MDGMGEIFGQVAFTVAVSIFTTAKIFIAVMANMLVFHTHVLTRHLYVTLITPEVTVIIIAVAYLLMSFIAIMLSCGLVSAVDDSVATIAIVVFVIVYVITYELMITFITATVVIIVATPDGNPYTAVNADVITVRVLVEDIIGIFLTLGFLTTDIAGCVSVLVDMIITHQLLTAFVATPIAVSIYAHIRHPATALIT